MVSSEFWPTAVFTSMAVQFLLHYYNFSQSLTIPPNPWCMWILWSKSDFLASVRLHWQWAEGPNLAGESWQVDACGERRQTSCCYRGIRVKIPREGSFTDWQNGSGGMDHWCPEWRSPSPTSLLEGGFLEHITENCVQMAFAYLQGGDP